MTSPEKIADSNVPPIPEASQRSGKKMAFVIMAVVLLSACGAGGWWVTRAEPDHAMPEKLQPPAPPIFVELEPFTVNLAGDHVLQTTVSLQVANAADANELKLYQPVVKSRMLMLLSSKSAEVLQAPQGKETLAAEVAGVLTQPYVKELLITGGDVLQYQCKQLADQLRGPLRLAILCSSRQRFYL